MKVLVWSLAAALVLAIGLLAWLLPMALAPDGQGGGMSPEEKTVQDYILAHAEAPASVEFLEWGPHDLEGAIYTPLLERLRQHRVHLPLSHQFLWELPPKKLQVVRVQYRCRDEEGKTRTHDVLVFVQDAKVVHVDKFNDRGKEWQPPTRDWVRETNEQIDKQMRTRE
jgi:hypothetical protein